MIIMHEETKLKYSVSKIAKNIEKETTDLNFAPKPGRQTNSRKRKGIETRNKKRPCEEEQS